MCSFVTQTNFYKQTYDNQQKTFLPQVKNFKIGEDWGEGLWFGDIHS